MKAIVLLAAAAVVAFSYAYTHPATGARACGSAGPFDFDTYEPENYITVYNRAIELAVEGKAINFTYSINTGETVDVRYQGLSSGPRATRITAFNTALRVPPSIYKSTAWIEASWANAAGAVPYGGVGPVLRSFDCGYGIGQITTGMENSTGAASAKQAAIGTHFLFNIAEGVRIMAGKWNVAPQFRPIAGKGDPAALEDWYYAIWSYNGFAFSNHPLNPGRDPLRGGASSPIYHCYDRTAPSYQATASGAPKFGYGDYTYPERVYGCMRFPPLKSGARIWPAQTFVMPDFTIEAVAKALDPKNFKDCESAGFTGGCPSMDFPTTIPDKQVVTHPDTTPPADVAQLSTLFGDPKFQYTGPVNLNLTAYNDGTATYGTVVVKNAGTWVAPFRVRTSAAWLVVRHADDPASRTLDGGVAVGRETSVVTQAPTNADTGVTVQNPGGMSVAETELRVQRTSGLQAGDTLVVEDEQMTLLAVVDGTRVTVARGRNGTTAGAHDLGTAVYRVRPRAGQPGYDSSLVITVIPELMPAGTSTGTVYIEPLLGSGGVLEVAVTATKGANAYRYRAVAPGVSSEP